MKFPPMRMSEFRKAMEKAIFTNQHKYGEFRDQRLIDFLDHFLDEIKELGIAIDKHSDGRTFCKECGSITKENCDNREAIAEETIDIATIAYMIWWTCTEKDKDEE